MTRLLRATSRTSSKFRDRATIALTTTRRYIEAVLRETLRLYPTAPAIARVSKAKQDVFIGGGRYRVRPNDVLTVQLPMLHRDAMVYGDDAEEFKPERFLDGGWEALPPDSWKPFGNSFRQCIGRSLAWQEAWMAIAFILQRFQPEIVEPDYELKVRQTLTIKPIGWHMKVRLRPGKSLYTGIVPTNGTAAPQANGTSTKSVTTVPSSELKPLSVLYGSNQGTCKVFAEQIQSSGPAHGLSVSVATLDSAIEHISTDRPVVVIAPSYEGQPADNAKHFVAWLEANHTNISKLGGVRYCVFGVGNSSWVLTFHRIPKLIDELMAGMGATQIMPIGLGNVAKDIIGAFDEFLDSLWPAVENEKTTSSNLKKGLQLEMSVDRPKLLGEKEISLGTVRQNSKLADATLGPEKRLMEVELPQEMSYACGDYLVVLPTYRSDDVHRVLNRFGIAVDATVKLSGTRKAFLVSPRCLTDSLLLSYADKMQPTDRTEYAYSLVGSYLELGTPISRKQLQTLTSVTENTEEKTKLERLTGVDSYNLELLSKGASILDVLEKFPTCGLSFAAYIDMLQPLHPRVYSIASSPLASVPGYASILYDVLDAPSHFNPDQHFHGVGSTYLAQIPVGGRVHCYVRSTNANFRLPLDPSVPIIMVCAGTGLAPLRGFLQERAAIAEAQSKIFGKALLYFGCRDPKSDYICHSEFKEWEKQGIVEVRPTFSKIPEASQGFKYVPDRLWSERQEVVELFRAGAKVFFASKLAKSTNEVSEKIAMEAKNCSVEEAREWLQKFKQDRKITDIFG
ncbi:hypothetical protein LTR17_021474 [Elasticomyces elasticus]|nr:hypothetical protein LTR17_021474 [Elasticomyces elasticus]